MALKDRLKVLKRQTGQTADTLAPTPNLAERLGRLRATPLQAAPPRQKPSIETVAEAVGGKLIDDGLIVIDIRLPHHHHHGSIPLHRLREDHHALPEARHLDLAGTVFVDTETTGLSGGAGTTVFLLGLGRLAEDSLLVRQYLITAFAAERAMLTDAARWLAGTSALVSYNGKSFDLPLLATRARLLGVADPFAGLPHLDLLHTTRRAFGRRWLDCRLATAERQLLGFIRHDDLPGSEAPEAWFAWLHRGDAGRLPGVARHNHWDIVSLAILLPALADVHRRPHHHDADPLAVARAALKYNDQETAYQLLRETQETLDEAGLLELARLHRGRGEWPAACAIWEQLAEARCGEALERLAKYYEHECHDFVRALTYAHRLPPSADRDHRCRRLEDRLEPGGLFE